MPAPCEIDRRRNRRVSRGSPCGLFSNNQQPRSNHPGDCALPSRARKSTWCTHFVLAAFWCAIDARVVRPIYPMGGLALTKTQVVVAVVMVSSVQSIGRQATVATVKFCLVMLVIIFLGAGSMSYWQGWLFLANFCGWCAALTAYFVKRDPELVRQRMSVGPAAEREPSQKRIQLFNSIAIIALLVIPPLDYRFGWSAVPAAVVLIGNMLVALGFVGCFFVLRQNSFAAATVRVTERQRVISTGLYGLVRHPMYASALPMFFGVPLALGSFWGVPFVLPVLGGLVARLLDEEKLLLKELPGYADYCSKVRWRLVPGVW